MTAAAAAPDKIAPLFDGPVDVIGDVHGEIDALVRLLQALGYDADGRHRERRRLVFVGDLADRGPDSPAAFDLVMRFHATGRAQAVLGNHELNLLRGAVKDGNGWFFAHDHDRERGRYVESRRATPAERERIRRFAARLPLALERDDLRVVHAAWHDDSLRRFDADLAPHDYGAIYRRFSAEAERVETHAQLSAAAERETAQYGERLTDPRAEVPLLTGIGACDVHYQMSNPLRVVTSGLEQLATRPFFASGKWRMVDRVPWWHGYEDAAAVVFGHYWRWPDAEARRRYAKGNPDPFAEAAPNEWLGPRRNAFCTDFSVGARHAERRERPDGPWLTRLGAVRWPEGVLVYEDGIAQALR
jgi:hypothetical protein